MWPQKTTLDWCYHCPLSSPQQFYLIITQTDWWLQGSPGCHCCWGVIQFPVLKIPQRYKNFLAQTHFSWSKQTSTIHNMQGAIELTDLLGTYLWLIGTYVLWLYRYLGTIYRYLCISLCLSFVTNSYWKYIKALSIVHFSVFKYKYSYIQAPCMECAMIHTHMYTCVYDPRALNTQKIV